MYLPFVEGAGLGFEAVEVTKLGKGVMIGAKLLLATAVQCILIINY